MVGGGLEPSLHTPLNVPSVKLTLLTFALDRIQIYLLQSSCRDLFDIVVQQQVQHRLGDVLAGGLACFLSYLWLQPNAQSHFRTNVVYNIRIVEILVTYDSLTTTVYVLTGTLHPYRQWDSGSFILVWVNETGIISDYKSHDIVSPLVISR